MHTQENESSHLTSGGDNVSIVTNASAGPVLPIQCEDGLHLDRFKAREIGESLSEKYCFAEPFPHIVLDNFLPLEIAKLALAEFPRRGLRSDVTFELGYAGQHKRQILPEDCGAAARRMFHFFNSAPILQFLEGLTLIQGLIPDPYFSGGGYHETGRGGFLGVHADFRINEYLHLSRRLNVIIYLNDNWLEEYGGQLEIWDRSVTKRCASISPVYNRCVIFNTDADSYHGQPGPLTCPEGVYRRSIALYYYTASREIYKEIPNHGTVYHARPTDDAAVHAEARSLRADVYINQWIPPVMQRYVFALRRRLKRR